MDNAIKKRRLTRGVMWGVLVDRNIKRAASIVAAKAGMTLGLWLQELVRSQPQVAKELEEMVDAHPE